MLDGSYIIRIELIGCEQSARASRYTVVLACGNDRIALRS